MAVIELLKNILPVSISLIAGAINIISKVIAGIATILYSIAVSLHMVLNTKTGIKLKEIEKATQSVMNLYTAALEKSKAQKLALSDEENKLAKIIKEDKNVLPLGKKKDDDIKD